MPADIPLRSDVIEAGLDYKGWSILWLARRASSAVRDVDVTLERSLFKKNTWGLIRNHQPGTHIKPTVLERGVGPSDIASIRAFIEAGKG
jgi:hypothetical protein